MLLANNWKDYTIIATGDGYKLEKWKDVTLLRPDPHVIWRSQKNPRRMGCKLQKFKVQG